MSLQKQLKLSLKIKLLPHQNHDVTMRITYLQLTVDFAVNLLDNHILSPLLMVMSLAVTADTDMMTVVF